MVTADDGSRALAIQMAAYYNNARVGVDKTHNNCVAGAPEAHAAISTSKHVMMDTPSMHNVAAAAARPLNDVTDAMCCHREASDEPGEDRSLLTSQSTSGLDRRRHEYQLDLQTI